MKKEIFTLLSFCLLNVFGTAAFGNILRVNNNASVNTPYTDLPAAVTAAAVGDSIYLESSATAYSNATIAKRLVIIGTGYFLGGSPANPYTQAKTNPSTVSEITCSVGSSGSVIEGVTLTSGLIIQDSMITVERNNIVGGYVYMGGYTGSNYPYKDTIRQNYIYGITNYTTGYSVTNLLVYNNIIVARIDFTSIINNVSGYIINNDFGNSETGASYLTIANFELQNNILYNPNFSSYLNSNVFFNNISTNSVIPTTNQNINNATFSAIYIGGTYTGYPPPTETHTQDSAFMLAAGSPAIGAGALNGTTVDCGAFGGPAPYILSGMPGIPSIYALTAPTQVATGTSTINVTISAASH